MTKMTRQINTIAIAFALIAISMLGYRAVGTQFNLAPSSIATVDLERLFSGLNERAEADTALQSMAVQLEAEGLAKRDAIESLNDTLDLYPVGSQKYDETMERLQLGVLDYEAFTEFGRRKLDVEKALSLKRIYLSIKECSQKMAESQGYDVVFVDDSIADLVGGTEAEIMRNISARRMLYTSDAIDVTDELTTLMNQAFLNGGCAP